MNVNGLARLRWTRHKKRSGGWVCALSGGGVSRHELLNGFSLPPSAKPARLCERVWSLHDDLWTRKRPQRNRLVVGPSPHVRDRVPFGLEWNFPQVARDRCEFNLFGSRLPRQRHELERGYCCFAHHAKRSNRFARTRVGT